MSASLFVWLPAGLLAVVSLLCFVGCTLERAGLGDGVANPPFTAYRSTTVLAHPNVVAFWPLGAATAVDLKGGHNGTYTTAAPYPAVPPTPGGAPSAPASGTFTLGQPGIVAGDTVSGDPAVRNTCVSVDGGYVNVPFDPAINPAGAFTIEAWVRVEWTDADQAAYRCVMDGRAAGVQRGFALFANPSNHWEVWVGNGGSGAPGWTVLPADNPFVLSVDGMTFYVVATYDGTTLKIFVDGEQRAGGVPAAYVPNDNVSPHVPGPLYIGTGAPFLPVGPPIPAGGPQWPFKGRIQDVAIYNAALSGEDILRHMDNGNGMDP
jgi:hypothetical protein